MVEKLNSKAASIAKIRSLAKSRIPGYAYEYLSGGCITDSALRQNRNALDQIFLEPKYLKPAKEPNLNCTILGQQYDLPVGIAPIGLSGLIWPRSAEFLAKAAKSYNIPFVLSTVGSTSMETAAALAEENFWFQLYPPPNETIRNDLIQRANQVGCKHLVVTIDVPALGRRPRDIQNGIGMPPAITFNNIFQSLMRPTWLCQTLLSGMPKFETLLPYLGDVKGLKGMANYVRATLKDVVDETLLGKVRDSWQHKLIVKGVLTADDAERAIKSGADAIWISNHGGRQLDAAPGTISMVKEIRQAIGNDIDLIVDSGVESGVDIAKFIAHGADMVCAGRAFMYGVSALGKAGADHTIDILQAELLQTLGQLRCESPSQLPSFLKL